jgi:hypothetical protein
MNKNRFYMLEDDSVNLSDNDSDNESINESINISNNNLNNSTSQINKFNQNNQNNKFNKFNKFKNIKKKVNYKKILCINYIYDNKCVHQNRCSYAHSLEEQNVDAYRQKTIDLLNSSNDLSYIDFSSYQNKYLMKDLLTYTKLCKNCIGKKCTGGYNCKFGSCLEKYLICYDDLNYGVCKDENCKRIHLSKRGLKPIMNKIYYTLDNKIKIDTNNNINSNKNDNNNIDIDNNYILDCINNINNINKLNDSNDYSDNNSDDFNDFNSIDIETSIDEIINNYSDNSTDSDNEDYINNVSNLTCLNNDYSDDYSDGECIRSIFTDKIDKLIINDE